MNLNLWTIHTIIDIKWQAYECAGWAYIFIWSFIRPPLILKIARSPIFWSSLWIKYPSPEVVANSRPSAMRGESHIELSSIVMILIILSCCVIVQLSTNLFAAEQFDRSPPPIFTNPTLTLNYQYHTDSHLHLFPVNSLLSESHVFVLLAYHSPQHTT